MEVKLPVIGGAVKSAKPTCLPGNFMSIFELDTPGKKKIFALNRPPTEEFQIFFKFFTVCPSWMAPVTVIISGT